MSPTGPPDPDAPILSDEFDETIPAEAALTQIRASLQLLRDGLMDLSGRLERPILEVGAFLESLQALESAKPTANGASRLVVALQSYDMFSQEIQLAERLIELVTEAIADYSVVHPMAPADGMLANAESACNHLGSAQQLITMAASEIPPAISQVLQGAGAMPRKFERWGVNRSLDEIGRLTVKLGETSGEVDLLRRRLAKTFGEGPEGHLDLPPASPEDLDNGSVTLF